MLAPEASGFSQLAQRFFTASDREHRLLRENLRILLSVGNEAQAVTLLGQFLSVFEQTTAATSIDDAADLLAQLPYLFRFLQRPHPELSEESWYVLALAVARAPLNAGERIDRLNALTLRLDAPLLLLEGVARGLGFVGFYNEDVRQRARQMLIVLKRHKSTQVSAEATAQLEELSG